MPCQAKWNYIGWLEPIINNHWFGLPINSTGFHGLSKGENSWVIAVARQALQHFFATFSLECQLLGNHHPGVPHFKREQGPCTIFRWTASPKNGQLDNKLTKTNILDPFNPQEESQKEEEEEEDKSFFPTKLLNLYNLFPSGNEKNYSPHPVKRILRGAHVNYFRSGYSGLTTRATCVLTYDWAVFTLWGTIFSNQRMSDMMGKELPEALSAGADGTPPEQRLVDALQCRQKTDASLDLMSCCRMDFTHCVLYIASQLSSSVSVSLAQQFLVTQC